MNYTRHNGTTYIQEFRLILLVRNLAEQRSFYEKNFDWPIVNDWGGGILYDTGTAIIELIQDTPSEKHNTSCHIAIKVSDVWSLFEKLKDKVTIVFPLRNNSWGDTSFSISDPDGFHITLFTPTK